MSITLIVVTTDIICIFLAQGDDDDLEDEAADQRRIEEELANEMSGLSSDDDFEPSQFHRHIRAEREPISDHRYDSHQRTGVSHTQVVHQQYGQHQVQHQVHQHESFSSLNISNEDGRSPVTYKSRIPRASSLSPRTNDRGPIRAQAYDHESNQTSGELGQVKALYSSSQRRVHDLTNQIEELKTDFQHQKRDLIHQVEMEQGRADDNEEKLKKIQNELESSEQRCFNLNQKLGSFERANENLVSQNKEFENRMITQERFQNKRPISDWSV